MKRILKLRGRSATEVRDRARQGIARWLERRGIGDVGEPRGDRLAALVGTQWDARPVTQVFFAGVDDRNATLAALHGIDPDYGARLCARADRILSGRYDLLGYRDLAIEPVDWLRDPVTGIRAPGRHWSQIRYLDASEAGDHKVVWELSRHNALVTLAQAWWCTGDTRYADCCTTLLESWMDASPPKQGIHWASSLEVALRSIAWTWVLALAAEALPAPVRKRMLGHLAIACRHVERHLSTWFSPNTHLTGEALGLFVVGTAFPQLPDASRWQRVGSSILLQWLDRHVRPDGSYVEQSSWYHRYTTDFYLHFMILSQRAGTALPPHATRRIEKLVEQLAWITRPDGTMPLIGDDDGGRLVFLDERSAHDTRTPVAVGATLFGRGDLAFMAAHPSPELAWLLGPQGLARFRAIPARPPATTSRAFPDGGLHVVRSAWERDAAMLTIDAGPHGFMNAGHAHADALSIDLTIDGRPAFVDPGTFTYTVAPEWRDHFRETTWHNAATVDGCGSAAVAGPFQWASQANASADTWYDAGDVVVFSGTHDGFERFAPAVRYRRSVVFVAPGVWIVRDEIRGEGEHELAVHWQCAPGLQCHTGESDVSIMVGDAPFVRMRAAEPCRWSMREGWVSGTYAERSPAPHLSCVRRGSGAVILTTVILPASDSLTHVRSLNPTLVDIAWGNRRALLAAGGAGAPGVETDAGICWTEVDAAGSPVAVTAAGATRLAVLGVPVAPAAGGARWRHAP